MENLNRRGIMESWKVIVWILGTVILDFCGNALNLVSHFGIDKEDKVIFEMTRATTCVLQVKSILSTAKNVNLKKMHLSVS